MDNKYTKYMIRKNRQLRNGVTDEQREIIRLLLRLEKEADNERKKEAD